MVGFALAGARIFPAENAQEARAAWRALPDSVAVVILTAAAAAALAADTGPARIAAGGTVHAPLTVVLP